ncbi:ankyrin repeat domain-containing protein SOWAHB [Clarias gariepinus]|uniref:ankyrin repeat domain-containing protein SOWAHB n=1 Tax=Clarias gariepinus TaxID=13013 RepID=UPI00234C0CBC|nr:ankyrin repeat domain-containing protein SOWAHB [Clarias gariepinus]
MALTQDAVLSFLLERGGKVKNAELVGAFTAHISCSAPEERRRNRDLFKSFINNVAVVKRLDDAKYVVVKRKYQEMINKGKSSIASSSSSSSSSGTTQRSSFPSITRADVLNNNSWFCTSPPDCNVNTCKDLVNNLEIRSAPCDAAFAPITASKQEDSLTTRVLNITDKTRKGAVFAVVSIKSPPLSELDHRIAEYHQRFKIPTLKKETTPDKSSPYPNHEQDVTKSPRSKRRQSAVPSLPGSKRGNEVAKPGFVAKDSSAKRLQPQEHDWLVKSATGHWSQIYSLLLYDGHLAGKRNFISGFTALHWAAKHGNSKMLRRLLDTDQKVDVNIKSHDGYTPLHVAAIHSHEAVLNLLVREYGANCNIRDNSGKKAYQYLHKDLSAEVRELLGDRAVSCPDEQQFPDLTKNLNTFSKLFQASMGHRKKSRHRLSFRSISDEPKDNRKDYKLDHEHQ